MARLLFLIRHGNTPDNSLDPPVICNTDQDLSDVGRSQVAALANNLCRKQLSTIYSSPFKRAWSTANAIKGAQRIAVPVCMRRALQEIDHGVWGGCTWAEVADRWPTKYAMFQQDPATYGYVNGENLMQVQRRMTHVMYELVEEAPPGMIAVVSPKQASRAFLSYIVGLPLKRCRDIDQYDACVNVLRFENGVFQVGAINQSLVDDDVLEDFDA